MDIESHTRLLRLWISRDSWGRGLQVIEGQGQIAATVQAFHDDMMKLDLIALGGAVAAIPSLVSVLYAHSDVWMMPCL